MGAGQDLQGLAALDLPRQVVGGEHAARAVEREAVIHRRRAALTQVLLLVSAVAQADPPKARRLHHVLGALVGQQLGDVAGLQGLLVDEGPPHRGLAGEERVVQVVVGVGEVLVGLRQRRLVEVLPHPHHGELEEPHHRRRDAVVEALALGDVEVDHQALVGHALEQGAGLGERAAEAFGDAPGGQGLEGELRRDLGLLLCEEQPQDPAALLGVGKTRRHLVQPCAQVAVRLVV